MYVVACDYVVVAEKHKMRYEMVTVFSILGDSKEVAKNMELLRIAVLKFLKYH